MKYEYRDLETISVDNRRWYHVEGDLYYPSITTILGQTVSAEKKSRLDAWRQSIGAEKADKVLKDAGERGTAVHLMCEKFLQGHPDPTENQHPDHIKLFNSIKLHVKKINEVWGQEAALYSHVLQVAGRTDLIGVWNGIPSIIDFKTSLRSKTDKEIEDYWVQVTFYALAHNEMFGTDIMHGVVIMAVENNLPLIFKKDLLPYVSILADRIDKFYTSLINTSS